MNKKLSVLVFIAATAFPQAMSAQQCITLTHDLKLEAWDSDTNGEVSKLQQFLSQFTDIYPQKSITGYYDPETRLAVYRWQKLKNILPTAKGEWGNIDKATRASMASCKGTGSYASFTTLSSAPARVTYKNGCPVFYRTLSRGMSGVDVKALQVFLASQGYISDDSITSFLGPTTEAAVREWQSVNGLISYGDAASTGWGTVGPSTRSAIANSCAPASNFVATPAPAPSSVPSFTRNWTDLPAQNFPTFPAPAPQDVVVSPPAPQQFYVPVTPPVAPPAPFATGANTINATLESPYTVRFSGNYSNPSCDGSEIDLDFGDNEVMILGTACSPTAYSVTHTYSEPGTYETYISKIINTPEYIDFETLASKTITLDAGGRLTSVQGTLRDLASVLIAVQTLIERIKQ